MSDEWYTPGHIFKSLGLVFDIDVCAPPGGIKYIPALRSFDVHVDGLTQEWTGLVWMNPPYSKPTPWVEKWLDHGNGVALVPTSKALWTQRLWQSSAKVALLEPNLKFERPDGTKKQIFMQCWLWAIGEESIDALHNGNFGKIR
jgi:hypothetical protein